MKTGDISRFAILLLFGVFFSALDATESRLEPLKENLSTRTIGDGIFNDDLTRSSKLVITGDGEIDKNTSGNNSSTIDQEDSSKKLKKRGRTKINSLLPNTEYCIEELGKLLDFNSIVSSSCGVDALKKVGGWLSKHKNSLPYWPSVSLPAPKNLITFYGCDWTICEREVENQIDQKLKKLHLPVKQIGNASQSDTRSYDRAKRAIDIQIRNGNMSRGELINSISIWWCQKALPQLITDKETAYHSIFNEFNIHFDQQSTESGESSDSNVSNIESSNTSLTAVEGQELSDEKSDVSTLVSKDHVGANKDFYKYPNRLVFLKTALEEPMECYAIEPEKDHEATKDELREILDSERNRLESNLAFVLQIRTSIWRSNKAFSPLGKSTNSVQRLISTMRIYTEEIRRDLFKLFPIFDSNSETVQLPPHEDLVILLSEICRIQSITDAISLVVIRLLRRNKISKIASEDAEHLLMNWMFADMNIKKSLIPVTKPMVTKKSSPLFIERAKRMKINASRITKFMNNIADKD
ncbi:uncharacterized protein cubi_00359 [Cryptosporidium ubiquitum]|uniref:Signal peptide-containing protein n=1 Tax=Cryptosporidium ubiquitum TaxID=857276 RepID=A0A1J4MKU3_9CRYT|nr:uncharacterized protein cubi_00359 [Cryptosporidium ubiquitum]OII74806.1 hypothetical protein cubi_00359 [Cryptosporidium ubiquitum]